MKNPVLCKHKKMNLSESSIITLSDSEGESEDPKVYTIDESDVTDDSTIEVITLDDSNANQSELTAVNAAPSFIPVPNVISEYGGVLRRSRRRPFGASPDVVCIKKLRRSSRLTIASTPENLGMGTRSVCQDEKLKAASQRKGLAKKLKVTCKGEGSAKKLKVTRKGEGSAKKLKVTRKGEGSAKKLKVTHKGEGSAKKSKVTRKGEGSAKKLKVTRNGEGSAKKSKVTRKGEGSAKKLKVTRKGERSAKKLTVTCKRGESGRIVTLKMRRESIPVTKPKITPIQLGHTNIHNCADSHHPTGGLRPVIIDGCNVAFGFGKGRFQIEGILMVVEYFKKRGHTEIVCFLPLYYKDKQRPETINKRVRELERENIMIYTPSRTLDNGQQIKPYDDRYILQYASEREGVVVSNDGYLDLINEESAWRITIEQRIINFTFARGLLMLPKDPLGPTGPSLDEMLKFP